MNMTKVFRKIKQIKGVSLIELLVSMTVFTLMILAATQIFKMVVDGQRNAISAQNVQENIRYAMERISKEVRTAQKSDTECLASGTYKVFNTVGGNDRLYFKNQYGDCITYYLENNRLKIMVKSDGTTVADDFITPAKIEVSNLKFYINDDLIGAFHSQQPFVVMNMDIRAVGLAIHEQKMKIQTTISSRHYE